MPAHNRSVLPFLLLATSLAGQSASLVLDINQRSVVDPGSAPDHAFELGGAVYFFGHAGAVGRELCVTDGTAAGTSAVTSTGLGSVLFNPLPLENGSVFSDGNLAWWCYWYGGGSGMLVTDGRQSAPVEVLSGLTFRMQGCHGAVLGNRFVFSFDDGVSGREVWVSDGTRAGTVRLLNRNLTGDGVRGGFVGLGGWLYYVSPADGVGTQLWRTDGTRVQRVFDDPMPGAGSSEMELLGAANGSVFFAAEDGTHGRELWRCDGTSAGTVLLDVVPGAGGLDPTGPAMGLGAVLVFTADDPVFGREPWRSDGSLLGTALLGDLEPGPSGSAPAAFTEWGGQLLFHAETSVTGREPWISDGTPSGTRLLADVEPGSAGSFTDLETGWITNSRLAAIPVQAPSTGLETLVTDGTTAGTLVLDLNPGPAPSGTRPIGRLSDRELLLSATTQDREDHEPWRTDGTVAGTTRIVDLNPNPPSRRTRDGIRLHSELLHARLPDELLLGASDRFQDDTESYLWTTDGQASGTLDLGDPRIISLNDGSLIGSRVIYTGVDPATGAEPWVSSGSGVAPQLLLDIASGPWPSSPSRVLTFRGGATFTARNGLGRLDHWVTDGTAANTRVLADLSSLGFVADQSAPRGRVGDLMIFYAYSATAGYEPLVTDGTAANTRALGDLMPGSDGSLIDGAVILSWRGHGYFMADTPSGHALVRSDGTPAGTVPVVQFGTAPIVGAAATAERLFLIEGGATPRVWTSDGTQAGTQPLPDFTSGTPWTRRAYLVPGSGGLYFEALLSTGSFVLMFADAQGLHELMALPRSQTFNELGMIASGSRYVWFRALASGVPYIWRSDGTVAGTRPMFGRGWRTVRPLAVSRGALLLAADDGWTGTELWRGEVGACVESFGFGCGAGSRAPSLELSDPVLGQTVRLSIRDARPGSAGLVVLGAPGDAVTLPNGCTMYIDQADVLTLFPTDGRGDWSVTVPLLNDPALRGLRFAVMGAIAGVGGFESTSTEVGTFGD